MPLIFADHQYQIVETGLSPRIAAHELGHPDDYPPKIVGKIKNFYDKHREFKLAGKLAAEVIYEMAEDSCLVFLPNVDNQKNPN